jgi:hypothetical protein
MYNVGGNLYFVLCTKSNLYFVHCTKSNLYFVPKVILFIESRKMKLTEHVAFVKEMEYVSRILVTNPLRKS